MTPKLILGPIVGGLTDTQTYLWGRADGPGRLHAWLGYQPDLNDAWLAGTSLLLAADNGYAGVVPLDGLQPQTTYYYALTLADAVPQPGSYPALNTFPASQTPQAFSFVFGSCYLNDSPNSGQIFEQLNIILRHLRQTKVCGNLIVDMRANTRGHHKHLEASRSLFYFERTKRKCILLVLIEFSRKAKRPFRYCKVSIKLPSRFTKLPFFKFCFIPVKPILGLL